MASVRSHRLESGLDALRRNHLWRALAKRQVRERRAAVGGQGAVIGTLTHGMDDHVRTTLG